MGKLINFVWSSNSLSYNCSPRVSWEGDILGWRRYLAVDEEAVENIRTEINSFGICILGWARIREGENSK
ncbi:hypothetical protein ScPMuIL_015847 [Solemya velum]